MSKQYDLALLSENKVYRIIEYADTDNAQEMKHLDLPYEVMVEFALSVILMNEQLYPKDNYDLGGEG